MQEMRRYNNKTYIIFTTTTDSRLIVFDDSTDTFSNYTVEFIASTLTFAPQFIGQNDMIMAMDNVNSQNITYLIINQVESMEYNYRLTQTSSNLTTSSSYSLFSNGTYEWAGASYISQSSSASNTSDVTFTTTSNTSELCIGSSITYTDLEINQSGVTIDLPGLSSSNGTLFTSSFDISSSGTAQVPGWISITASNGSLFISQVPTFQQNKDFAFAINFTYYSTKDPAQQNVTLTVKACKKSNCNQCERGNANVCISWKGGYRLDGVDCVYDCYIDILDTKVKCIWYTVGFSVLILIIIIVIVVLIYCKCRSWIKKKNKPLYKIDPNRRKETNIGVKDSVIQEDGFDQADENSNCQEQSNTVTPRRDEQKSSNKLEEEKVMNYD